MSRDIHKIAADHPLLLPNLVREGAGLGGEARPVPMLGEIGETLDTRNPGEVEPIRPLEEIIAESVPINSPNSNYMLRLAMEREQLKEREGKKDTAPPTSQPPSERPVGAPIGLPSDNYVDLDTMTARLSGTQLELDANAVKGIELILMRTMQTQARRQAQEMRLAIMQLQGKGRGKGVRTARRKRKVVSKAPRTGESQAATETRS